MAIHFIPNCPICGTELIKVADRSNENRALWYRWSCERYDYRTPWTRTIEEADQIGEAIYLREQEEKEC